MCRALIAVVAWTLLSNGLRADDAVQLAEAWNSPYVGTDATGNHVVGLWCFDAGGELADSSGHGHDLTLNGARITEDGRFGGCLESWRGWPDEDTPHQARTRAAPELTPKGPFTVEMWIKPKPEIAGYPDSFLLDSRYVDESGMQLILSGDSGAGRRLRMLLGTGDEHPEWTSNQYAFEPDVWHHIAFTYDGRGSGRFYVNGTDQGGDDQPEYGAVAPGTKPLTIGDRVGSLYHGFPGYIDQVRICQGVLEFRAATFAPVSPRRVFVRMEQQATVSFALINQQREAMTGAKATFSLGGIPLAPVSVPDLAPGERHMIELELDTRLRPDVYRLAATVEIDSERPYRSTQNFDITIVPRPLPHKMPVVMWGNALGQMDWLTELGFTHSLGTSTDYAKIWAAAESTAPGNEEALEKSFAELDKALAHGIGVIAGLSPGRWANSREALRRVGSDGEPIEDDVCGLFPEIPKFCYNVGASVASVYGEHPALQAAMVHTEVRGHTRPCYHPHDLEALTAATGLEGFPQAVTSQRGTRYQDIPDFPSRRVLPDDYPLYVYYKWFWKQGDGWNAMHTALHEGLKSGGHDRLWTFHDPAARVASVYGNGGDVDYLSHWPYSYPDPIRIGLCADELFCMAGGASRGDQKVMKMTQIIWYRSQTAPEPGEQAIVQAGDFADKDVRPSGSGSVDAMGRYRAAWERKIPDARFVTIAPMHLREAFWSKISRPIQGIMYHGWGSLVPLEDEHRAYRYTHPETKWELKRLIDTVVRPLGPTLVQVPDRKSDVAFLESFASQMFARRGTYGWNGGWEGDAYLILRYAGLQPRVIYEETIQQEGLDDFQILVMPACDVLPQSVVAVVQAFQAAGGTVVGDENLCPAIEPDIVLPTHVRPREADQARRMNMAAAEQLRSALDTKYQRYADSSTPNVLTRVRRYGSTDYLFAVNDLREFGDYVGHHGLVMENGLPCKAELSIRHPAAHVYDLLTHREVTAHPGEDEVTIAEQFGPCEGRLFMVTNQAIDQVRIRTSDEARAGDNVAIEIGVLDNQGLLMDAVVPLEVEVIDPAGRAAEFSGYYGAKDGTVAITATIAPNDVPGLWRIHVRELASGRTSDAYVRVTTRE
jgi:hypothetical protein